MVVGTTTGHVRDGRSTPKTGSAAAASSPAEDPSPSSQASLLRLHAQEAQLHAQQQALDEWEKKYRDTTSTIDTMRQQLNASRAIQEVLETELSNALDGMQQLKAENDTLLQRAMSTTNAESGASHATVPQETNDIRPPPTTFADSSPATAGHPIGGQGASFFSAASVEAGGGGKEHLTVEQLHAKLAEEASRRAVIEGKLNQALREERETKEESRRIYAERDTLWQRLEEVQGKLNRLEASQETRGGYGVLSMTAASSAPDRTNEGGTREGEEGGEEAGGEMTGGTQGSTSYVIHQLPIQKLSTQEMRYAVQCLRKELKDTTALSTERSLEQVSKIDALKATIQKEAQKKAVRNREKKRVAEKYKTTVAFMKRDVTGRKAAEEQHNVADWIEKKSASIGG